MSKIRQILRMYSQGRSKLSIATQVGVSRNTAKRYFSAFDSGGCTFEQINALNDKELEDFFGKSRERAPDSRLLTLQRCFPGIDKELKRTGVTRVMLWEAYLKEFPNGFHYTQFCFYYNQWKSRVNPVMHLDHKAGDKLFVDFAGQKLSIVDQETGEVIDVEVFVAILGASQLTYVEAVLTQQKEDFISACENTFHYISGVSAAIVPDNLKAAVTKSNKYEPTLNETFADFADHYGTTILPARAYRPRDKALVEGAVKIAYSRIYAPLRKHVFHSLTELNAAILVALEVHNSQPLKGRNYSRRLQFEEIEREALNPLPVLKYEFKKQHHATVMKNGHVNLGPDKHYYSVPFRFIGKKVKILYSRSNVEIFYHYERIAMHKRIKSPYSYTTDKDHMATTHKFVTDWTPDRFLEWASSIDEDVRLYILKILDRKQHPEQAYKSCVGILSFAKKAGNQRLINACRRALGFGIYSYKTIQTILERNLDQYEESLFADELPMPSHDNIRGGDYYK
ncbi:IS21 family transposase [Pedobacter mucosus]|uniref:IS21 family transposase n=1 Tax=Pedobacter mucosus TaxID=2895286 RepID=UPI001EE4B207|nr:IS21 family transposase [Pedobacter mucosus]UKT64306.1 IS21 family transposase [Pedobacter mucosus]UKT65457.1 IS21 family transposase [Pedobacter mucosus]UKT66018.1 IS21 family transposase [Pedobacter mucosus]